MDEFPPAYSARVDLRIGILRLENKLSIRISEPKPDLRGSTPDQLVAKPAVERDARRQVVDGKSNAVDLLK
jgi:hypothetical protein